jgi:hypothetical protein
MLIKKSRSDAGVEEQAENIFSVVGPALASYGLSSATWSPFVTSRGNYTAARESLIVARANAMAAAELKNNRKRNIEGEIARLANLFYNNPNVTDSMLIAAGFAPRDQHRTPAVPKEPTDLLAKPSANGTVKLSWKRNGNARTIIFVVEAKPEVGEWKQVFSTTRTSCVLRDYTPGHGMWFRVIATKQGESSIPSNETPIYHADEDVQLEIAA